MNKFISLLIQIQILSLLQGVNCQNETYEEFEEILNKFNISQSLLIAGRYFGNITNRYEERASALLGRNCSHELWRRVVEPNWYYQGNGHYVNRHHFYRKHDYTPDHHDFFRKALISGLRLEVRNGPVCHHKERFAVKCGISGRCECDSRYYREINNTCLGILHAYCGFSVGCVEGLQCLKAPDDELKLPNHGERFYNNFKTKCLSDARSYMKSCVGIWNTSLGYCGGRISEVIALAEATKEIIPKILGQPCNFTLWEKYRDGFIEGIKSLKFGIKRLVITNSKSRLQLFFFRLQPFFSAL